MRSDGGEASAGALGAALSADGRYVVFDSFSDDIVPPDENQVFDVFRRDLRTGTTVQVSLDTGGGDPNGSSLAADVTADGRYVLFASIANDLVALDGNNAFDIFRRDMVTGRTTRISVDTGGGSPNGNSFGGEMSPDGRFIVFQSEANDLVPGDGTSGPNTGDIFVKDMQTGMTKRVSVDMGGGDPNGFSAGPRISADGTVVAFSSHASDLVQADGNAELDVFVRNLTSGTTTRANVDTAGGDSDAEMLGDGISLSADGRFVAFASSASDLVAGDGDEDGPFSDAFVRDVQMGVTTRVSTDLEGEDGNGRSRGPVISGNGRYVAFESEASDLIVGDSPSNGSDIFVHDRATGVTTCASEDGLGRGVPGSSSFNSGSDLSNDGRYVAFGTDVPSLVANDTNTASDVFVRAVVEPSVTAISPPAIARGSTGTLVLSGHRFPSRYDRRVQRLHRAGCDHERGHGDLGDRTSRVGHRRPIGGDGSANALVFTPGTGPGPFATAFTACGGCLTVT